MVEQWCEYSRFFKGAGVPWVQIMENEFECLVVRGGDGTVSFIGQTGIREFR